MVSVVDTALAPVGVTEATRHEVYAGRPVHAKLTGLLNPPEGVMEIVEVALLPRLTDPLAGLSEMLKSAGGAGALTATVTAVELLALKDESPA
jgi:hypothetical protein